MVIHPATASANVILYPKKDIFICQFSIQNTVLFVLKDYVEFMDDGGVVWRIKFDIVEDGDAFAREYGRHGGQLQALRSGESISMGYLSVDERDREITELKKQVEDLERTSDLEKKLDEVKFGLEQLFDELNIKRKC